MSFVIFGCPLGWKGLFVWTGARERSLVSFPPRPISIICSSFPLVVLCLFPNKWLCHEYLWRAITCGSPPLTLSLEFTSFCLTLFMGGGDKFTASWTAAPWTQFVHAECHGVLFTAGSFFWVVHFPCMAEIAFSDISGDVDYFAFVSHLYGKGLQV